MILKKLLIEQTTERESAVCHMFLLYLNKNIHSVFNPVSIQVNEKTPTSLNKFWNKVCVVLHLESFCILALQLYQTSSAEKPNKTLKYVLSWCVLTC